MEAPGLSHFSPLRDICGGPPFFTCEGFDKILLVLKLFLTLERMVL
jgi:hypothetical protein